MERNFFRRIEVAFPVRDARYRQRIIDDMEAYLSDNTQAWELQSNGEYLRSVANDQPQRCAQQQFLNHINNQH
jgi:polyphosphate kinase